MKAAKKWGIRILSLVLAMVMLGSSVAFAEENRAFQYVALGDSITAGYEPWMKDEWEKTQVFPVPYGFVERVYEQALYYGRTDMYNYGILGLTSTGFYNLMKAVEKGEVITASQLQDRSVDPRTDDILAKSAEMKANIENADLITVMIGANDFLDLYQIYNTVSSTELKQIVTDRIAVYKDNLTKSLQILFALNPDVQLVIADQYQPFPKLGGEAIFNTLSEYNKQLTAALEEVISGFSNTKTPIKILYVGERFVGRELQLVNINLVDTSKSDPHPRQAGFEVIAKAFSESIWGEYKVVTSKDPIGIVVNGKELVTQFKPVVENGTTYVPVREYVEALGGTVEWDQASQSAIANFNGVIVKYKTNSNIIEVNGEVKEMKAFVRLIHIDPNDPNAKTYVPLRALAEDGLQLDVKYIQKSNTAYINP